MFSDAYYNFLHKKFEPIMIDIIFFFNSELKEKKLNKDSVYNKIANYLEKNLNTNNTLKHIISIDYNFLGLYITFKKNIGITIHYNEHYSEFTLDRIIIKDKSKIYMFTPHSIRLYPPSNVIFGNNFELIKISNYENSSYKLLTKNSSLSKKLKNSLIVFESLFKKESNNFLNYLFLSENDKDFEDKISILYDIDYNNINILKQNLLKRINML